MNSNLLVKSNHESVEINTLQDNTERPCCKHHSKQKLELKNIFTGDILGIVASLLCLFHCLALPFIFSLSYSYFPDLLLQDELIHLVLFPLLVIITLLSVKKGYNLHKHKLVGILGLLGVSSLLLGVYLHKEDNSLDYYTIIGGTILCLTHLLNIYKIRDIKTRC